MKKADTPQQITNPELENKLHQKIILISGAGMFLSTLDSGIINIALPKFVQYFHTSISIVSWTVTLYLILLGVFILAFGQLGDKIGKLKIYQIGLAVFCLGSIFCAISPSIFWLIIARGIQGIGASMLQATSVAIRQGKFIMPPSKSLILVDLSINNGKITKIMAGGKGISMLSKTIEI
ncbi:MFS transporter [Soonwooa sp.]|uniref:MFS transporter n=1 Tax=Soonwooa sp. TaxID=1938592 RepID=UPI002619820C|nr:MFS transporter [Soonwooa sp.]